MSSSRYPDNNRYPRERSPLYRDRRPSTYTGGGYPQRANDAHNRPPADSTTFTPRDAPRGPKSLVDGSRGPPPGPPSALPSGPRDGHRPTSALRDAPPLSTGTRGHNMRDQWRAGDRDRDRDFRDRRPSPPRRSPIRDSRDHGLTLERGRRNSRDGPLSAGSTYSDPPLPTGSSYRGSGARGGRGGRDFGGDFRPRGRGYFNDDRDRHHDARDIRERMYRPRSRSREPPRREVIRDEREFDRRERDDRRFERREEEPPRRYDSYQGSASTNFKPGLRGLDTHRGSATMEPRNLSGPSGGPPTPHSAHHAGPGDRMGPAGDHFSRRSSTVTEPQSAKDARRDDMIASRVEFSKERYAPRASSPPASVPAFGFSNVWINPALDSKPPIAAQAQKPAVPASTGPPSGPAAAAPPVPQAPKPVVPAGLTTTPPTGPKADRIPDRPQADLHGHEHRPQPPDAPRADIAKRTSIGSATGKMPISESIEPKPDPPVAPSQANAIPVATGIRNRPPPLGPQAALRQNATPSFPRTPASSYAPRDASPGAIPIGPRNGLPITSPKTTPMNIPTGPKADRANSFSRPSAYGPPDRPGFPGPRMPHGPPHKSNQWVNPRLNRPPAIPAKREFPAEDRERSFGSAPKAPRLESSSSSVEPQRPEHHRAEAPPTVSIAEAKDVQTVPDPAEQVPKAHPSKPEPIQTRRRSDVSMPDISPRTAEPPVQPPPEPKMEDILATQLKEDSEEESDLDDDDFAVIQAKFDREKALLESKLVDLSAAKLRATSPLHEIMLLANLSAKHLPQEEQQDMVEEIVKPPVPEPHQTVEVQEPPAETPTTELPTPRAEEIEVMEDVVMVEKQPVVSIAPATRALRRRPETPDRDDSPEDFSSLPYLVSAPPTPISDPDQDRPGVSESVLRTIREQIRKDAAPKIDPHDVLREYAAAYKRWRQYAQGLDQDRDHEDSDKMGSGDGIKATTPDISGSASVLDSAPTTGRREHSRRWGTELDLEHALKVSILTAQAEKKGKEYEKMLWDPEKEATVPSTIPDYEAARRRFFDTNYQREPGQGVFVYHYEPPEDDFTEQEHKVMVQHYRDQYAKKWGKLAEILYKETGVSRTYKDTINHYYATKWNKEFKHGKGRRRAAPKKKGTARARAAAERAEREAESAALPLTDTGRPRRQAAPTFGADAELESASASTPGRQRRQTEAEGVPEKPTRRTKAAREKGGRKAKNQPLAAAPTASPAKVDRKEKVSSVKTEEDLVKSQPELPPQIPHPTVIDDPMRLPPEPVLQAQLPIDRPRSNTTSRGGASSYWSVTEQNDFQRNVAHFGTDWIAIANHMGTKTHTMVKNQYLRLVEHNGSPDLVNAANEADRKRERGEDLGPPPTPTPAPKRRYDNVQTTLPRALAPTPEGSELLNSPPPAELGMPRYSPAQPAPNRFPNIAQGPMPASHPLSTPGPGSMPESSLAALPSMPPHRSPPPVSHVQVQHQQVQAPPQNLVGPRMGYFVDDQPLRIDSRGAPHTASLEHPARGLAQAMQQRARAGHDATQSPLYHPGVHPEREPHSRLEHQQQQHEQHEPEMQRYQQHTRQLSREVIYGRQFPPNAPLPAQAMGPAISEGRQVQQAQQQQHRYIPPHSQLSNQPPEIVGALPGSMAAPPQLTSRGSLATIPAKEDQRHYQLQHPQAQPHPQQPLPPPAQPPTYSQPTQSSQPPRPAQSQPPPAPKTSASRPRKSNLLSLLNDEPEEPRPTPPRPTSRASSRGDVRGDGSVYGDVSANAQPQPQYARNVYAPPQSLPQSAMPQGPQVVDLTTDNTPPVVRPHARSDSWQVRQPQPFNIPVSQGQQQGIPASLVNSPHTGPLNQPPPPFGDARIGDTRRMDYPNMNHRSVLAQHNISRANPSPPPRGAPFTHSPHLTPHSRTSSVSAGPPPSQLRQNPQPPPNGPNATTQILQRNPYTEVEPPGSTSRPPVGIGMRENIGMRGSPHPGAVPQRGDLQPHTHALSHNEQSSAHNATLAFPGSTTSARGDPNAGGHPGGVHSGSINAGPGGSMRPPSMHEHYGRQSRELPEHGQVQLQHPQTHDRDTGRELGMRIDALREVQAREVAQREAFAQAVGPREAAQREQQLNEERIRGMSVGRSYTPLSQQRPGQGPGLGLGPGPDQSGFPPRGYRNEMYVPQGQSQSDGERERFADPRMAMSLEHQQRRYIHEQRLEQQRALFDQEHDDATQREVDRLAGRSPRPPLRIRQQLERERQQEREREGQRELEHRLDMHHRVQSQALERERGPPIKLSKIEREVAERERELAERDRQNTRELEKVLERERRYREERMLRMPPGPGPQGVQPSQQPEWANARHAPQHQQQQQQQQSRDREREREREAQHHQAHAQAQAQAQAHAQAQRDRHQSRDRSQGLDRDRERERERDRDASQSGAGPDARSWQQPQQIGRHNAHQGQAQPR